MDSAQNPLPAADNTDAMANIASAFAQKGKMIYPVRDSSSYISPYEQRNHSWTDGQYNQSNEVTWSGETNTTAADHLDWVVNEQGTYSRLYPADPVALSQQK